MTFPSLSFYPELIRSTVLPMACAWAEEQKAVILRVGLHSRHRGSPMRACRDHTLTPARSGCVACHRHEARATVTV